MSPGFDPSNELAFEQPFEADLVDRLQHTGTDSLSLVAEDDAVVGHILFTPVVVETADASGTARSVVNVRIADLISAGIRPGSAS